MIEESHDFARTREWVDPDGVLWHRRGDHVLSGKDLGRRLRTSELRVVHHYLGEFSVVPVAERESFWASAEDRMRASTQSDFRGVEFRSDDGGRLLVVDEYC